MPLRTKLELPWCKCSIHGVRMGLLVCCHLQERNPLTGRIKLLPDLIGICILPNSDAKRLGEIRCTKLIHTQEEISKNILICEDCAKEQGMMDRGQAPVKVLLQ